MSRASERVIREAAQVDDLRSYLNGAILREVWRSLFFPSGCGVAGKNAFPT